MPPNARPGNGTPLTGTVSRDDQAGSARLRHAPPGPGRGGGLPVLPGPQPRREPPGPPRSRRTPPWSCPARSRPSGSLRCWTRSTRISSAWPRSRPGVRKIAALLLIDRLRQRYGLASSTAQPAHVLHRQPGHRQDHGGHAHGRAAARARLPAQGPAWPQPRPGTIWSGSTSGTPRRRPRRRSSGRWAACCLIDEAYDLYRPENERDYGQEAIEYSCSSSWRPTGTTWWSSWPAPPTPDGRVLPVQPRMASRVPHRHRLPRLHRGRKLIQIALRLCWTASSTGWSPRPRRRSASTSRCACSSHGSPNAPSIRNAIDRMRLRQARRLVAAGGRIGRDDLMSISDADVRASRVFGDSQGGRCG